MGEKEQKKGQKDQNGKNASEWGLIVFLIAITLGILWTLGWLLNMTVK